MSQPSMTQYYRYCLQESLGFLANRFETLSINSTDLQSSQKIPNSEDSTLDLCTHCREINIVSFLNKSCQNELSLGLLLDIEHQENCSFCHFLKTAIRNQYDGLLADEFWKECKVNGEPVHCVLKRLTILQNPVLGLQPGACWGFIIVLRNMIFLSNYYDAKQSQTFDNATFNILKTQSDSEHYNHRGRLVPSVIDFALPKQWLDICEKRHPYQPVDLADLRVIDLELNCLVIAPHSCRYIALSYVWGNTQTLRLTQIVCEKFQAPGGLSPQMEGLPRTIIDAMKLCKSVGERFLWVDSLCIIQDVQMDIEFQIKRMDVVYSNAILTLVACYGTHANSGLPGVTPGTRFPKQYYSRVGTHELISYTPDRWRYLDRSTWRTRAWTYQEQKLSNRFLYVTGSQLHFNCTCGCEFCEEIALEVHIQPTTSTNTFPQRMWDERQDSFSAYATIVSEFSSRTISYPRDALNAIHGIMTCWRKQYWEWFILEGLPSNMIDAALLFKPKELSRRRRDSETGKFLFPSWSWAGWEGPIEYEISTIACETVISMVTWDPDLRRREELLQWMLRVLKVEDIAQAEGDGSQWNRVVGLIPFMETGTLYYTYGIVDSFRKLSRPVKYSEMINVYAAMMPDTKELRFHASCAFFSITSQHNKESRVASLCEKGTHTTCLLTIFDEDGIAAGAVHLGSQWTSSLTGVKQEFVALSRTTLVNDVWDPSWDEATQTFLREQPEDRPHVRSKSKPSQRLLSEIKSNTWHGLFDSKKYDPLKFWPFYNVLLIIRNGDVAFRIGIGKIHVDAFDSAAVRRYIRLS